MGTDPDLKRSGSGVWIHFSEPDLDPDLNFREKTGSGSNMYGMMYIKCKVHVCK